MGEPWATLILDIKMHLATNSSFPTLSKMKLAPSQSKINFYSKRWPKDIFLKHDCLKKGNCVDFILLLSTWVSTNIVAFSFSIKLGTWYQIPSLFVPILCWGVCLNSANLFSPFQIVFPKGFFCNTQLQWNPFKGWRTEHLLPTLCILGSARRKATGDNQAYDHCTLV